MKSNPDRLIIHRVTDPERIGILVMPDTVIERPQKGIVEVVGSRVEGIEEGDCVIFQPWSDSQFMPMKYGWHDYASITPNVVVAKLYFDKNNKLVVYPYQDRVAVSPAQPRTETDSGLYIARTKEEEVWTIFGEVVETGPDCQELKAGDKVVFPSRGGVTVDVATNERCPQLYKFGLFLFHEHEILGVLQ